MLTIQVVYDKNYQVNDKKYGLLFGYLQVCHRIYNEESFQGPTDADIYKYPPHNGTCSEASAHTQVGCQFPKQRSDDCWLELSFYLELHDHVLKIIVIYQLILTFNCPV